MPPQRTAAIEEAIHSVPDKIAWTTYSASGAAVIGGITLTDWLALGGFCIALISAIYNIWHKRELRKIAMASRIVAIDRED